MRPRHSRFCLNFLLSASGNFCVYFNVVIGAPYRVAGQTPRGAGLLDVPLEYEHYSLGYAAKKRLAISSPLCHNRATRQEKRGIPMYDELTEVDIKKMKEEIDYRVRVLRPRLIEDVQTARAFGDLSENFEYKCAKQEKNRNDSRIRYLQRMVSTAKVISTDSGEDTVGLFDKVVAFHEKLGREMTLRIVTTLRSDAGKGLISKESPVGKAILGRKAGDRVHVKVSDDVQYDMVIRSIEKGEDDESLEIRKY